MTPQELKTSILSLAFKGRLSEQSTNESAKTILVNLLKKGPKNKKYIPFSNDLAPYDIPDNWEWCMFHNVVSLENGNKAKEGKLPYLEARYLRTHENAKIVDFGEVVYPGQKGILVDGENSGEVFFFNEKGYMGSTFKLLNISSFVDERFVLLFMKLHQSDYRNNKKGAAIPHLNKNVFYEMPFPLPPLEEQKRIVDKIEKLLPLIDRYEIAWAKLEKFNKQFPNDMEKSILELAVRGKLVEQKPGEDASAEYKLIIDQKENFFKKAKIKKGLDTKIISDGDLPFDIPNTWKWIRLGEFAIIISKGTTPRGGNVAYLESGIGFLRAENVAGYDRLDKSSLKYIDEETHMGYLSRSILEPNDILVTIAGTLGRTGLVRSEDLPLNANQAVSFVRLFDPNSVDLKYIIYSLNSPSVQKVLAGQTKTTAIPNLTLEIIRDCLIPLPPLEEQKRIVAKLEELLPLCRKLIK